MDAYSPADPDDEGLLSEDDLDSVVGGFGPMIPTATGAQAT